jgi:hypothetical protein
MTYSETAHQAGQEGESGSTPRWCRHDWAVLILLALLIALFFWRILTPNLADRAIAVVESLYLRRRSFLG